MRGVGTFPINLASRNNVVVLKKGFDLRWGRMMEEICKVAGKILARLEVVSFDRSLQDWSASTRFRLWENVITDENGRSKGTKH
jgi:hypothetical protein